MRTAHLRRSFTARFFALVFIVQLVSAAALLLAVRHLIAGELGRQSRTLVETLRDDYVAGYRQGGTAGVARLIDDRVRGARGADAVALLEAPAGGRLAGNIVAWPVSVAPDGHWHEAALVRIGHAEPERVGVVGTRLADGSHLLAGHVIERDLAVRDLTGAAMLAALLLAVPLSLGGAIVATHVVTGRVDRIAETARGVSRGDLSRRVPVDDDARDAFADLARTINRMLDRIDTLLAELRIVTDSLAHDLRSPLTRMRATIDRAQRETTDEAAAFALERVGLEAQALLAMLTTALEISRVEAGIGRDRFVETEIGAMLADLAELYEPLAEQHGVTLSVRGGGRASVHRELLGQAIANLVDNALRYGAVPGAVTLHATATETSMLVSVADDGPGIPAELRAEALRRFGRLGSARSGSGAGLGLSLAAAVARLHAGTLTLGDNLPGLVVMIEIPHQSIKEASVA